MRIKILLIVIVCFTNLVIGQSNNHPLLTEDFESQQKWVDSLYTSMTIEEKVGQLFMVQVFSNQDQKTKNAVIKQIREQKIGGLIYSKGGPVRQAKLNNELQAISKLPLLIGMDAEWV